MEASGDKSVEQQAICNVWKSNIKEAVEQMKDMIFKEQFNWIAISCVTDHVISPCFTNSMDKNERMYEKVRLTVNMADLIQVAFTLFNCNGKFAQTGDCSYSTWQFNIQTKTSVLNEQCADNFKSFSDEFHLKKLLCNEAIDLCELSQLLHSQGLFDINSGIKWFTFNGGLDVGFLGKMLTNCDCLPDKYESFDNLLKKFLKEVYDVKLIFEVMVTFAAQLSDSVKLTQNKSTDIENIEEELQTHAENLQIKGLGVGNKTGERSHLIARIIIASKLIPLLGTQNEWTEFNYNICNLY